ncbi:MAG: MFS transporter, partial [Dehalococcoidia bacterium]
QRTMAKRATTQVLAAVGLGFVVPFFTVMFVTKYHATTADVGNLFAISTVGVALLTLFTPLIVNRLGMVRGMVSIQMIGIPFLLIMAHSPSFWFAGGFFLLREAFSGIGAGPSGGMASPVERLFPMQIVKQHERGTTNGIMHAFLEFPMSVGAFFAGPMMVRGDWGQIYLIAAFWFASSFLTFYYFFNRVEARFPLVAQEPEPGGPGS